MATNGPKISPAEMQKFQAILKLPAGEEKTRRQQELTATEKEHFKVFIELVKRKQALNQHKDDAKVAEARLDASQANLQAQQERAKALQVQMQEAEAGIRALEIQQADLQRQDRAILTQASSKFAGKLDSFTREKPSVKTTVTTAGTSTLKY